MIRMVMIRHGKTCGNLQGRYIGVTDEPLCQEGISELKEMEMDTIELLFVSPMRRCMETAELLYPYAKKIQIPELAECNFGEFENKNYQELQDNPKYQEWVDSMATLAFPGGESVQEFKERSIRGFDKVVDTCIRRHYKNVALIVHGGTIMSVMEAYGMPKRAYYDWHVNNGCGYHICLSEQNWKMGRREAVVESEMRR
ncbi:MAG: histidine phosphatase family protein [Fusicatenibacter sp.]|nr:histidine phosphatase family protein [Lachnospiraceae bacterium]MDY2937484.1 histidine phosphatase family protein [Fusicatenibacter sp.]